MLFSICWTRRHPRRMSLRCETVEALESRIYLSPFTGNWNWEVVGANAGKYFLTIDDNGGGMIEAPGQGGLPIQVTTKGKKIIGTGQSQELKVKFKAGPDNRTSNDGGSAELGEIEGKVKFSGPDLAEGFQKAVKFIANRI